ncbi:MAG: glycosyltransferase family 9 protein [Alphaproteobacteria bacterium]|nr:glycosyltransferase family 9 protein [Alphaproteobacteria bacterium]
MTKSLRALDLFCTGEEREPSEAPGPASWLIAIGGGIGDILHCTPAIANIARHTKQRPDVLVAGDHPGAEFLVQNPEYVNRVWTLGRGVLQQAYRNVFVTHSFGPLRLAFNAKQVRNARDWQHFHAGGLHETLFNLEAAKALLGIPYDEADAAIYFAGNLERREPDTQLVGLHAGSKGGRWLSKRWPYFGELTRKLHSRGVRVASFGTPDEYVPGTENLTGGTIEEMCRALSGCTLFVSNDSGAMHLASALGIRAVAIFAPTDALTHMPLTETVAALTLQKDCSPCEVKNHAFFASGRCACVGEIPVEAAEGIILSLLSADEADRGIA